MSANTDTNVNITGGINLTDVSNEIRASMNGIIEFAELAQYGNVPQRTREYLWHIQESAEWLLGIVNSVLGAAADLTHNETVITESEKPVFDGEVLICEDNSLNQQVICEHLARVGIKTVLANNGKEGVDIIGNRIKAGEKPFDLIFMDIHMPVMDGLEAAAKIAGLGINTPVIALTANIMASDIELYKSSGMPATLGKPFTTQELWSCLEKYIPVKGYAASDERSRSAEDEELQRKLRVNFVKNNRDTYAKIINALDSGDIKTAHRLVHTLKSNAGQIGKKNLQEAAGIAESKLSGGQNQISKKDLRNLEAGLNAVLDELAPLLAGTGRKNTDESAGLADTEKILELFDKLEPMLKDHDTDCLGLLDEIYLAPGTGELAEQIENYNFKKALETLEGLKKKLE